MENLNYISNNKKIDGTLNKVNDNDEITIICHARLSSKDSRPTLRLANELEKINMNSYRFSFVFCGESEGELKDYTVSNMKKNLEDAIKMLKEKYNYKNFILIGCSMGGRIISLINEKEFNIKSLILWYPALDYGRMGIKSLINLPGKKEIIAKKQGYYNIENNRKLSYEYFKDERKYLTYKYLEKKELPILFVHGSKDPYVPYESSKIISKKCKNSELALIKDGDHGFHDENNINEAIKITNAFINKNRKYPI